MDGQRNAARQPRKNIDSLRKEPFDSSDDEADVSRFRHFDGACENPRSNGGASSADKDSMNRRGIDGNLMNGVQSTRMALVPHRRSNSEVKKTEAHRKKRRLKLVARKTVMEQKWPKGRKVPLSSLQKMKLEGTLVQHLEHCHYGEEGEYVSSSPIPNITFAKWNRKYMNVAKMQTPIKSQKFTQSTRNAEVWFDTVVIDHLKKVGWIQSTRSKLFELKGEKATVRFSRERLVEIISRSRDELKLSSDSNAKIVSQVEELILIDKVQRHIDVETMVQDSSCRVKICERNKESTSILNSKDEMHSTVMSPSKQSALDSSKKSISILSASTGDLRIFEKSKLFPKYIADSKILLFTDDIIDKLSGLCKIKVSDSRKDDKAVVIRFRGFEIDVDIALSALVKNTNFMIAEYNSKNLIEDPLTIELDIKLDVNQPLGFKSTKGKGCLWVHTITDGGQLQRIIGAAANGGAAITYTRLLRHKNWEPIIKNSQKKAIIKNAKMAYESSLNESDKWVLMRICLVKDENLGGADKALIVRICCRNGFCYSGKFQARFLSKRTTGARNNGESLNMNVDRGIIGIIPKKRPFNKDIASIKETVAKKAKEHGSKGTKIQTDKDRSFRHFSAKTKDVKDIEFTSKKVHIQAANRSMWTQHKREFGEHRDSMCSCVEHLSDLTKNVVQDFVTKKEKKDIHWKSHSDIHIPIGFVDSFCPRFYNKVQKEFPKDLPQQTMTKLANMWRYGHQKQRQFNGKCSNICSCLSAWDEVFLPVCKGGGVKMVGTRTILPKVKEGALSKEAEFDIHFKPTRTSLGFFCETDLSKDEDGRCVITSVDPGNIRVSHILCGTIIVSYQIGNAPANKVTSCQQIELQYNVLKTRNTSLTLKFQSPKDKLKVDCSTHWSRTNTWIGSSENQGWAGGAMLGHASKHITSTAIPLGHTQKYLGLGEGAKQTCKVAQQQKVLSPKKLLQKRQVHQKSWHKRHSLQNIHQQKTYHQRKSLPNPRVSSQQGTPQSATDSKRNLSFTSNDNSRNYVATQPYNTLKTAPKILQATGSSASGAKVHVDETKNTVVDPCIDDCKVTAHTSLPHNDKVEKLNDNVLRITLEALASSLKHLIQKLESKKPFEKPLELLKIRTTNLTEQKRCIYREDITEIEKTERRKEIDHELCENDLKQKLLKIYARPHNLLRIIGKTTTKNLAMKNVNFMDHIIKEHKHISKEVRKSLDEGARFDKETLDIGRDLDFEVMNIHVFNVSLLHAAAFAADQGMVRELIEKGVLITDCVALGGTALDVAKFMHAQAQKCSKLDWASKYLKVVSILETDLKSV